MHDWQSMSHVRWDCKYHVVFVPKYRKKKIFGGVRRKIGVVFQDLCRQRGVELLEGHAMTDHVHMCLRIPPKLSVAHTIGFLKGKSAIRINRKVLGLKRLPSVSFWATGYCVSTVGLDEKTVREYIRDQEKRQKEQLELDLEEHS